MRFKHVHIAAVSYDLPSEVVTTRSLEEMLVGRVKQFPLPLGKLEAVTGVSERRFWPRGERLAEGAVRAAKKALSMAEIGADQIGALIYAGVCRDHFEPATACAIADQLSVHGASAVHDVSNACLGALTAMWDIANRIELGQIEAGLVVTNESARDIIEETIARLSLCEEKDPAFFMPSLATFTGGSAACAVLLTRAPIGGKLLSAAIRSAPKFHRLCTWGLHPLGRGIYEQILSTDAQSVLHEGLLLGAATWRDFLAELGWNPSTPDRVVMHQVSKTHQHEILKLLEIDPAKDFATYPYLGNTGSAALVTTLALAAEKGVVQRGDRVAMLGIGSGLSCLMMGVEW